MKKMMLAGLLLAMSSIAMADSAQDVLKKAREKQKRKPQEHLRRWRKQKR